MSVIEQIIDPIDQMVGLKLRALRHERGMSQQALAEKLDLSFQQIQKYERGTNRVSASTLWHAAKALKVPVASFFEDTPEIMTKTLDAGALTWAGTQQGSAWMQAGRHLPKSVFLAVLEMVRAVGRVQ